MTTSAAPSALVYLSGLGQGIALVSFPAIESVLVSSRSSGGFGLTPSQYGAMFVPQVVLAIVASVAGGALSRRLGLVRVLRAGLAADLLSALLLLVAAWIAHSTDGAAYLVLPAATACLGAGFGLTVPALNTLAARLHPDGPDRAGLVLNALLGTGTALAPIFAAVFLGLGIWPALPVVIAVLLAVLGVLSFVVRMPDSAGAPTAHPANSSGHLRSAGFVLLAALALLYGIVETLSGNWGEPLITSSHSGSALAASIGLTAFWASVTVGRLAFAALQKRVGSAVIYRVLPFAIAIAYGVVLVLSAGTGAADIALLVVSGLGCSALLPLTLSFGEERFANPAAAGLLIAFYQVGYGVAAFGVGPLRSAGLALPAAFGIGAVAAVVLGIGAVFATRTSVSVSR